ncbi:MAG: DUF2269 domain-containing protein [Acidimicrobiia bacterium]|nr:DUF2269 domain-containing protein [Acidimicrobiia bacterium]
MDVDRVVLFVHVLAAMILCGAGSVAHVGMAQLLSADGMDVVRRWGRTLHHVDPFFGPGSVVLFLTGAYLVDQAFRWGTGWIVASVAGLVAIEVLGITVNRSWGKRLEAVIIDVPDGPVPPPVRAVAASRGAWLATHGTTGTVVGILYLMTAKPTGTVGSLLTVAGFGLVGALTALPFLARRRAQAPTVSAAGSTA